MSSPDSQEAGRQPRSRTRERAIGGVGRRALWLGSLIAASAVLTALYACVAPVAAFAVVAVSLPRRLALAFALTLWLANQAVGFGLLHYPWTGATLAWGLALGGAAVMATLGAQWAARRLERAPVVVRTVAAFAAAFGVHQATLFLVAATILGGTGAFVPQIVGQVLLVNAVALVGLVGLEHLAAGAVDWRRRTRVQASLAPSA